MMYNLSGTKRNQKVRILFIRISRKIKGIINHKKRVKVLKSQYKHLELLEPFGTGLDFLGAGTNNMKSKKLIKLLDTSGKNEILQFWYGFRL